MGRVVGERQGNSTAQSKPRENVSPAVKPALNIIWSQQAQDDLTNPRAFIAEDSARAAQRMAMLIVEAVETRIPDNPKVGRPGRVSGTRELVIPRAPYIVPYRLRDGVLEILRVYHGARRWPDQF